MATTTVSIKNRPVRIGLLVRPNELSDLEKAAAICSLLWGGKYNPIIPVANEADEKAEQLIKLFQIDVLFPISHSDGIDKLVHKYPFLQRPLGSADMFYEDWRTKKLEVFYLDALNAIEKYWQKDFKHAAPDHPSNCALIQWDENDYQRILFALSYGLYPKDLNLRDDFAEGFLFGLRAKTIQIQNNGALPAELVSLITPLSLTGIDLKGYGGLNRDLEGAYFGKADNFTDLVAFWNFRAAGNNVIFAPIPELPRFEVLVKAHFQHLDNRQDSHPNIPDDIHIVINNQYRGRDNEVTALLANFPTRKQKTLHYCGDDTLSRFSLAPMHFIFDYEQVPALVEKEPSGYCLNITLPEKKFLAESERNLGEQYLAISIDPLGNFGFPDHTLAPPFRPELSEFYSRQIDNDPWSIRSEDGGIAILVSSREKAIKLKPIKNFLVVEALFRLAQLEIEPSQGGRLADRLSEKLKGIEGARVFKIRGIRNLIAKLNSQDSVDRAQVDLTIWNEGQFQEHKKLYIEQRDTPDLTKGATFDFLLRHEFFRAGLEFICSHCGLENWLSLRKIDDQWVCEFCGHEDQTSLHIRHRGDWKFRKSGLLAKDNNQEGAIPVLLSLLVFERVSNRHKALSATSIKVVKGMSECEIDFLVINYRHFQIECAFGEAKSAGGSIDANDIGNMKLFAKKLRSIEIKPHFVFSKTADSFTPDEINLFKALKTEGHSVILLTNKEIEPYNPYFGDNADQDGLPRKYAHSFDEMALNSDFRYLK